jgi:hypothetical protein
LICLTEKGAHVKRIVTLGVILVISFVVSLPIAEATPPTPVTITINQNLTGPTTATGTFTASGAISDSGDYAEEFRLANSGAIQGIKTLTSESGTITLRAGGKLEFTSPTTAIIIEARWVILSGTGAYSGLHGQGSATVSVDFTTGTAVAIHEGVAHFD